MKIVSSLLLGAAAAGLLLPIHAESDSKESSSSYSESKSTESEKSDDSKESYTSTYRDLSGGTASTVQAKARPFGLDIEAKVMAGATDTASKEFSANALPGLLDFIKSSLPEAKNNTKSPVAFSVDPSKLTLKTKADVRVYFCYEGAGYHNTLGFLAGDEESIKKGVKDGDAKIIFPDASSTMSELHSGPWGTRTASEPLLPGDFVNLGSYDAGTKLDFFLIADGANGGKNIYGTDDSVNPDGVNHIASFTPRLFAVPDLNSSYLFLAFEDLYGGGDKDYNDVIFAIDVGQATINALLATPEPTFYLTIGSFAGLAFWAKRRRDRQGSTGLTLA